MKPAILVADGNANILKVYEQYFSKKGYRVHSAADGLECLRKLRQTRPSVLIIDKELPWGQGEGVIACMREGSDCPRVPVILVSASGPISASLEKPPVFEVLLKPFSLSLMTDVLFAALHSTGSWSHNPSSFKEESKCSSLPGVLVNL